MGTRGLYAIFYNGIYYVFYNQMDSYPEGLGNLLVMLLKMEDYTKWGDVITDQIENKNFIPRRIEYNRNFVEVEPTAEDIEEMKETDEWEIQKFGDDYSVRLLKWNYKPLLKRCGFMYYVIKVLCDTFDRSVFLRKSKNVKDVAKEYGTEWTYIIDLDNDKFSVLGGKNDVEFKINKIPVDWIDKINA